MPSRNDRLVSTLPSISTRKLLKVLKKIGVKQGSRSPKGSHEMWVREIGGKTYAAPIVLGKKDIPEGTLKSILRQLNIPLKEFMTYLGIMYTLGHTIKTAVFGFFT